MKLQFPFKTPLFVLSLFLSSPLLAEGVFHINPQEAAQYTIVIGNQAKATTEDTTYEDVGDLEDVGAIDPIGEVVEIGGVDAVGSIDAVGDLGEIGATGRGKRRPYAPSK